MIFQIRPNVFETNSSSTHSLNICTEKEYDDWKNDSRIYFCENVPRDEKQFITEDELKQLLDKWNERFDEEDKLSIDTFFEKNQWGESAAEDYGVFRFDDYYNHYEDCLQTYVQHFTTPSNDEMVAFGYYGTEY